ncbi:hypothetical protein M501DRAFT_981447 [Patellaria atrata CBS 101060]|uniref:Sulfhydryl oxidase n=1 Tax=Patellaria atrata CBS 101060 TaxID=1346257 RepID=A0A9P4VNE2_9PEZI|nr:hypothetical protein M501DRAFT_981447 [Patellaria atrata CBS 101060]
MPVTSTPFPILSQFLCQVEKLTGVPPQPLDAPGSAMLDGEPPKELPKGVVIGPDGKPCRTCTSSAAWKQMLKQKQPSSTKPSSSPTFPPTATATGVAAATASTINTFDRADCPPDVEQLGRSSWTLLHSITATYPRNPPVSLQQETRAFVTAFSKLYPCWTCAEDFQAWLKDDRNAPKVSSREEFGRWMCEAHNAVNVKLGKERFDCDRWEERWRTGWKDGRCD